MNKIIVTSDPALYSAFGWYYNQSKNKAFLAWVKTYLYALIEEKYPIEIETRKGNANYIRITGPNRVELRKIIPPVGEILEFYNTFISEK